MAGKTKEQWKKEQETLCRQEGHCYLIPDYYEESHGKEIARSFAILHFIPVVPALQSMWEGCWQRKPWLTGMQMWM